MIFDMDMVIHPSSLSGSIEAIPSKSHAHRLLICAAMADRPSFIALCGTNDDIDATVRCLKTLGADIVYKDGGLHVTPISGRPKHAVLDCGESGSTLRFLLPVAAALAPYGMAEAAQQLVERAGVFRRAGIVGDALVYVLEHGLGAVLALL